MSKLLRDTNPSKTFRTLLLEKYLNSENHDFQYLNDNCLIILQECKTVYLAGSLSCYKVRVDLWNKVDGGDFYYGEYEEQTPRALIFRLVAMNVLPAYFLPSLSPYPYAD